MKKSYVVAILTPIFLSNASPGVSPPRYQLTTLSYIYYRTNLGASYEPVSIACAFNTRWIFILWILTHPRLTLHLVVNTFLYNARLDPYIQKFVSNTVSYCIYIAFSPYLFNPSIMIYTTPSGRLSSAKLLRWILTPISRAYNTLFLTNQHATRRRGSLSERYLLIRLLDITL